jgi:hypothetical protein
MLTVMYSGTVQVVDAGLSRQQLKSFDTVPLIGSPYLHSHLARQKGSCKSGHHQSTYSSFNLVLLAWLLL